MKMTDRATGEPVPRRGLPGMYGSPGVALASPRAIEPVAPPEPCGKRATRTRPLRQTPSAFPTLGRRIPLSPFTTLAAAALWCVAASAPAGESIRGALIFPPQGEHVHGSSIAECPNGDLIAVWFQGSGERSADDVRIMGSRLRKGAAEWETPYLAADTPDFPDCNPVVWIDPSDKLWLAWIVVNANRWENSILKLRTSTDYLGAGEPVWNWQDIILLRPGKDFPEQLKAGFRELRFDQEMWAEYARPYDEMLIEAAGDAALRRQGWMTRAQPMILPSGPHAGRVILPLYSDGFNVSLFALSDDGGESWRASRTCVGLGNIQPTLARKKDGTLCAWMRDSGGPPKRAMYAESKDDGETWSAARDCDLPNPGSSLAAATLPDGRFVMALNDTERGRHRLSIFASDDEGKTWGARKVLEESDPASGGRGSYGYPTLIVGRDGALHVTYTHAEEAGKSIKHVRFTPEWIGE